MGFRSGAYAKVWEILPPEEGKKTCKGRISISKKNKSTGEYVQDFADYVIFIGEAAVKAQNSLTEGARIKLGDVEVSNTYNKEKKTTYYSNKIFSFDLPDEVSRTSQPDSGEVEPVETTAPEGNYPF